MTLARIICLCIIYYRVDERRCLPEVTKAKLTDCGRRSSGQNMVGSKNIDSVLM